MAESRRRGDPFDGLSGFFALWIALTAWVTAMTDPARVLHALLSPSLAVDGYLIICGVMAARAARRGVKKPSDLPRFWFWRILRFAPSLLAGFALFSAATATLVAYGLSVSLIFAAPGDGFFDVNAPAIILGAALIGSLLLGAAAAFGVVASTIGKSGIAAFVGACIAARLSPGMELTSHADLIARIGAAFALGVFLEGVAATGGFARAMRRIKLNTASGVEASAVIFIFAVVALRPGTAGALAPVMLVCALSVFTRKRGAFADQTLGAPFAARCGRAAAPIVGCAFILTWPVSELSAMRGGFPLGLAVILAPLYVVALFGLAVAVRRLVEDPINAFAAMVKREMRAARRELEALEGN